jgi:hypothetical protein
VVDVDVAAEEDRVEERRRQLADTAAVVFAETVLDDDRRLDVPLRRRALPESGVEL